MKVLLINGSPNKKGCTNRALEEIEKELKKEDILTEIFHIGKDAIYGCIGCGNCNKTGRCFRDDVVNEIGKKLDDVDGIVIGTPVYYSSPNGALIAILDRLFYAYGNKLMYKPASAIASARRAGTTTSIDVLNKYFGVFNMPIVSSNYWNMVHGKNPSEVEQDLEGLQTMRMIGKNMSYMIKSFDLSNKNGIKEPKVEDKIYTNFHK